MELPTAPHVPVVVPGNGRSKESFVVLNADTAVRVATFNIERGYKLDSAIQHMKQQKPDVILLQELDWGCKRTQGRNCVQDIATELDMHGVFVTEFEELSQECEPTCRDAHHGNAILTKLPIHASSAHGHVVAHDWSSSPSQPRNGGRVFVSADIEVWRGVCVRFFSLHLENKCGIMGRVRQMCDLTPCIISETTTPQQQQQKSNEQQFWVPKPQFCILGGDLNTLMHGLVRFDLHTQPGDTFRFSTFGQSEAEWWTSNLGIRQLRSSGDEGRASPWLLRHPLSSMSSLFGSLVRPFTRIYSNDSDISDLVKEKLGWLKHMCDPFSRRENTLDYTCSRLLYLRSFLYGGKLDWLMYDERHVTCKATASLVTGASDHKLMWMDLTLG